ncbi:hypothetical protein NG791_26690 [Laspinema sp. D1]|uniref:hypothetical protein n=1 Tax=Laspinema palackyanum TaxID=3231601 RepID=UPI0034827E35|nr:hypothetical protein [Laspinema sp. D2b]
MKSVEMGVFFGPNPGIENVIVEQIVLTVPIFKPNQRSLTDAQGGKFLKSQESAGFF